MISAALGILLYAALFAVIVWAVFKLPEVVKAFISLWRR